jgi:glycosyltransferase 2 family protein
MKRLWVARLIGPVILIVVLINVDVGKVWALFNRLSVAQVLMAACAFVGLVIARCERWHLIVNASSTNQDRWTTYRSCLRSIWLGTITPGRVGELMRFFDLTRHTKMDWRAAGTLVAFDLSLDLGFAIAIFLAATSVAWLTAMTLVAFEHGICISLAVGTVIILVMPLALKIIAWLSGRFALLQVPAVLMKRLVDGRSRLIAIGGLALLPNAFYFAMMVPLFAAIDPTVTAANTIVLVVMSIVAGAVPITYFGLGTREVAFLALLAGTARTPEMAVALSLMFIPATAIGFVVTIALDGLLRLAFYRRQSVTKS